MKISELIQELESAKSKHGDIHVVFPERYQNEYVYCIPKLFIAPVQTMVKKTEDGAFQEYKVNAIILASICTEYADTQEEP